MRVGIVTVVIKTKDLQYKQPKTHTARYQAHSVPEENEDGHENKSTEYIVARIP